MTHTSLIRQHHAVNTKYPDAMLLFRVGDFYETSGPDAVKCSQLLDIVLIKRSNGTTNDIDFPVFPYHALDTYLSKLIRYVLRVGLFVRN